MSAMEASPKESEITQNLNKEESSSAKDGKLDTELKILGISCDVIQDKFCYDFSELIEYAEALPASKQSVLKLSARIFDLIGLLTLLTPFTVNMKVLFPGLYVEKVNWQGTKLTFFSRSHLAPKFYKVVAKSKKLGAISK